MGLYKYSPWAGQTDPLLSKGNTQWKICPSHSPLQDDNYNFQQDDTDTPTKEPILLALASSSNCSASSDNKLVDPLR